ncbi:Lipopolysaccharide-induced tumor necrosis factor-alpha factor like protein [Habropoda laboriosa]|uniref:Lipopolysaccharide-induced tumor necrosis factor-alpha factor like protein n=1 Tax=Habropoda laboriosa TaxID=597456 RepID=A0A0L7QSE4_9HYME|nr:PREDICTED: lipopolysaccharide-induced tumor necrosis factor-alpha factor homolog [Habropoda laboriosa]KOC61573.1 Lipopolysaccharide-induced tumor necrosis factor-alpha factor like protein [Habropoda laboriosa]
MNKDMPAPPPGFVPPPPPPPYFEQPQQQQPHIVVVERPVLQFGRVSQRLQCPHCHADISTRVESEANTKTHLIALLLCILGLWCCAPCPYCMDSTLVQRHYCPSCGSFLGEADN